MRLLSKARPLFFLGIILVMVIGITSVALAEDPVVTETEAPVGEEVVDEGGVIPPDDERPPAVEPDMAPEPDGEEPSVIAPAPGIEEPMVVNPEGTIGIDEQVIAPASPAIGNGGWSADDWGVLIGSALGALLVGAAIAFLATRRHYINHPLTH